MIKYDHQCTKTCIQQDYLGPSPIFNHHNSNGFFVFHELCMIVSRMKLRVMNFTMMVTLISLAILQSMWSQRH